MIFSPHRVSTAAVHIIYTLCCLSVIKYLYIPKLLILTFVTLPNRRKNAHKKLQQTGRKIL